MKKTLFGLLLSLGFGLGCGGLEPPAARGSESLAVRVEPLGELAAAPAVLRLRLSGAAGIAVLSDFELYSGALSTYHLGRIRRREQPQTLRERQVPVLTFLDDRDIVVAPIRVLEAGVYSLAAPDLGLVAEMTVDAELVPILPRHWPPAGALDGSGPQIFCGEAAVLVEPGVVRLAPTGAEARVDSGVDDRGAFAERCVRLEPLGALAEGSLLLPPPLAGGLALEPLPLVIAAGPPRLELECAPPARVAGPACLLASDDRLTLTAVAEPSLWAFERPEPRLETLRPGVSLVVRGLEEETRVTLSAAVLDRAGRSERVELELQTGRAVPHLVINEVLADPLGPEAQSEWIELVNDGRHPLALGDFSLADVSEALPLPDVELAPGGFAVLVAEGYAPEAELDVIPPEGTRVLALPRLGRSGLANSGELLRLLGPGAVVVSRWPLRAAPAPGTSLARRTPEAPDGEAASFARHAEPGASPGGPNQVTAGPP